MLPTRKTIRLQEYDYSANGAYFITICTVGMKCVLSRVDVGADDPGGPHAISAVGADDPGGPHPFSAVGADDPGGPQVHLTEYGQIVEHNIQIMREIYPDIRIDNYVIMPNHVHILLSICKNAIEEDGAPRSSPPTNTLSNYVAALKKFTGKAIGENIWQRSYFDHVIRDERDYAAHLQYIDENPTKWLLGKDEYYS